MTPNDLALAERLRHAAAALGRAQSAALAPHGVTVAEATVLRTLHEAGVVAPSALAARCGLTRGAVTKLVDRLRAKRLVVRAGGGRDDRRYQTIALTGAGATLAPMLTRAAADGAARMFDHLTPGDRAALFGLLADPRSFQPDS